MHDIIKSLLSKTNSVTGLAEAIATLAVGVGRG